MCLQRERDAEGESSAEQMALVVVGARSPVVARQGASVTHDAGDFTQRMRRAITRDRTCGRAHGEGHAPSSTDSKRKVAALTLTVALVRWWPVGRVCRGGLARVPAARRPRIIARTTRRALAICPVRATAAGFDARSCAKRPSARRITARGGVVAGRPVIWPVDGDVAARSKNGGEENSRDMIVHVPYWYTYSGPGQKLPLASPSPMAISFARGRILERIRSPH